MEVGLAAIGLLAIFSAVLVTVSLEDVDVVGIRDGRGTDDASGSDNFSSSVLRSGKRHRSNCNCSSVTEGKGDVEVG